MRRFLGKVLSRSEPHQATWVLSCLPCSLGNPQLWSLLPFASHPSWGLISFPSYLSPNCFNLTPRGLSLWSSVHTEMMVEILAHPGP